MNKVTKVINDIKEGKMVIVTRDKNEKYRELGYDDNPYEIAARKAEKKWKQYL